MGQGRRREGGVVQFSRIAPSRIPNSEIDKLVKKFRLKRMVIRSEPDRHLHKRFSIRVGAGTQEMNEVCLFQNHRTDLQEIGTC